MNSEKSIVLLPFIREFTLAVIRTIHVEKLCEEEKQVIHSDLVPKVSEKVMQVSLVEKHADDKISAPHHAVKRSNIVKKRVRNLVAPPKRVKVMQVARPVTRAPPKQVFEPKAVVPQIQVPPVVRPIVPRETNVGLSRDYGKITLLLNDPSVSTIECQGAGKALTIIQAGRKQMTKIILSAEDIKNILGEISDAVRIPLLEGVFRAAVDNFSINAVISDTIGSRFVIKKQTAYSMLER